MPTKTLIKYNCFHCGEPCEYMARSKAEAARMTGPGTCGRQECREALRQESIRKVAEIMATEHQQVIL